MSKRTSYTGTSEGANIIGKKMKSSGGGTAFKAALLSLSRPEGVKCSYYELAPLYEGDQANGFSIPYFKNDVEVKAINNLASKKVAVDANRILPAMVKQPGESVSLGTKEEVIVANPKYKLDELLKFGFVIVDVTGCKYTISVLDKDKTKTKKTEKDGVTTETTEVIRRAGSVNVNIWGNLINAQPATPDQVARLMCLFKPKLFSEYPTLSTPAQLPENFDFTHLSVDALCVLTPTQKPTFLVEVNNGAHSTECKIGEDYVTCLIEFPEVEYADEDPKKKPKRSFVQETGKDLPKPVIRKGNGGIVLEGLTPISGRQLFLSGVFWSDQALKFGVFSAYRWSMVVLQVLRGLCAKVAVTVNLQDTLALSGFADTIKPDAKEVTYAGTFVFAQIDFHATFSVAGLRVSKKYAFNTIARNLLSISPAAANLDEIPEEVDWSTLELDQNGPWKSDMFNSDADIISRGDTRGATCILLNEYSGSHTMFKEEEWDFYFVPTNPLIPVKDFKKDKFDYLVHYNYKKRNADPNALALNEAYIHAEYLPIPGVVLQRLPLLYFFAVKKL